MKNLCSLWKNPLTFHISRFWKEVGPLLVLNLLLACTGPSDASLLSPVTFSLIKGGETSTHTSAGILLTIPEKWHVYAPTPPGKKGAGFPPSLTWADSENVKTVETLWPPSHKTKVQDQQAYVYEGNTLIPLLLLPIDKNKPIILNLKLSMLACAETCRPLTMPLTLTIAPGDPADALFQTSPPAEEMSLFTLLTIALLGGLILNFMPCVLPVLSLKVMSLIKQSKKTHRPQAKTGFLLTGLGIITSFFLLACFTIVLKESGEAFGWGIHFQNPHFLLFVFLVLVAFTASLWGVLEIDLPSSLGNFFVSHEGKGQAKDFFSGVFATLLATPCSAPFVGTALSFALSRDARDILLVFFCLGLGFASPYFLVASLPPRFIILPKPGAWMIWTQKILGIFLALTATWIGWILCFHLPLWTVSASLLLAFVALFLFWLKHHKSPSLPVWRLAFPLFAGAWGLSWVPQLPPSSEAAAPSHLWQPFKAEAIPDFVRQGKVVLVDVTAQWCVTCAVNKQLVLSKPHIEGLLTHPSVVALRADWTKRDGEITHFLQKYGRYGIPFNIVFGPGAPEGIPLPEILTPGILEKALKAAL